jgi:hypothetical protein
MMGIIDDNRRLMKISGEGDQTRRTGKSLGAALAVLGQAISNPNTNIYVTHSDHNLKLFKQKLKIIINSLKLEQIYMGSDFVRYELREWENL